MKFKNAVFVDQKFMETIQKCNEYEDWEPKVHTGSIDWSKNYDLHKKIIMIQEKN